MPHLLAWDSGTDLEEPLLSAALLPAAPAPDRSGGSTSSARRAMSSVWQSGSALPASGSEVQFVLAQTLVGSAPAVSPDENRLGMAWEVDPVEYSAAEATREDDNDDGPAGQPLADVARPASRYSSALQRYAARAQTHPCPQLSVLVHSKHVAQR